MTEESALATALGASVLFAASHVPQVARLARGPADGVSATMFAIQLVSGVLWLAYGALLMRCQPRWGSWQRRQFLGGVGFLSMHASHATRQSDSS